VELGTHVYGCRVVQKALEMLAPATVLLWWKN
jgi:hypothetical protein